MSKSTTAYVPLYGFGEVIEGWRVYATTPESAQMQIEERMIKRAFFSLRREWVKGGKRVREVEEEEHV